MESKAKRARSRSGRRSGGNARYDRGIEILKRVGGEDHDRIIAIIKEIAPDLSRFTVEFAYGDVVSRPKLDLRSREIVTVAALAAMGNARPQLDYHITGALNVGAVPEELVEIMNVVCVIAGFPAAINGLMAVREVLASRDMHNIPMASGGTEVSDNDRFKQGRKFLEEIFAPRGTELINDFEKMCPDLGRFAVEFFCGDVLSRDELNPSLKGLCLVATSSVLHMPEPDRRMYIQAALALGCKKVEIIETILQIAVYAGFPAALSGMKAAQRTFGG